MKGNHHTQSNLCTFKAGKQILGFFQCNWAHQQRFFEQQSPVNLIFLDECKREFSRLPFSFFINDGETRGRRVISINDRGSLSLIAAICLSDRLQGGGQASRKYLGLFYLGKNRGYFPNGEILSVYVFHIPPSTPHTPKQPSYNPLLTFTGIPLFSKGVLTELDMVIGQ